MITGGEDALYIARRLIVCSSEDIGMADPLALPLVSSHQYKRSESAAIIANRSGNGNVSSLPDGRSSRVPHQSRGQLPCASFSCKQADI